MKSFIPRSSQHDPESSLKAMRRSRYSQGYNLFAVGIRITTASDVFRSASDQPGSVINKYFKLQVMQCIMHECSLRV